MANRFLLQAFGGHEHVAIDFGVEKIDRTHLGIHGFANTGYDDIEGRLLVLRSVYLLDYFSQSFQHHDLFQ